MRNLLSTKRSMHGLSHAEFVAIIWDALLRKNIYHLETIQRRQLDGRSPNNPMKQITTIFEMDTSRGPATHSTLNFFIK